MGGQAPQLPPFGWYPDPTSPGLSRLWDGTAWTPHTSHLSPAELNSEMAAGTDWRGKARWLVPVCTAALAAILALTVFGFGEGDSGNGAEPPAGSAANQGAPAEATGGGEGTGEDEMEIEALLVRVVTTGDPSICSNDLTQRYLDEHFARYDQGSLARCIEVNEVGDDKGSLYLDEVAFAGDSASATATVRGGEIGKAEVRFGLVRDSGWKLDTIDEVDLDRHAFLDAQRGAMLEGAYAERPEAARLGECIIDYVERNVRTSVLETSIATNSEAYVSRTAGACIDEFRTFFFSPEFLADETGLEPRLAECITRYVNGQITAEELRGLYLAVMQGAEPPESTAVLRQEAMTACTSGAAAPAELDAS